MNAYSPPLKFSQHIEHWHYARLEHELKPTCRWVDFNDYIWSYGQFDYNGKVVLDIGADIGSSALYFLSRGAEYVYLVENDPNFISAYQSLKAAGAYQHLKDTSLIASAQIAEFKSDILKMDCEGCEQMLLTKELLSHFKEWVIGLHKPQLDAYQFEQKQKLLQQAGGKYLGSVNAKSKEGSEYVWKKKL